MPAEAMVPQNAGWIGVCLVGSFACRRTIEAHPLQVQLGVLRKRELNPDVARFEVHDQLGDERPQQVTDRSQGQTGELGCEILEALAGDGALHHWQRGEAGHGAAAGR